MAMETVQECEISRGDVDMTQDSSPDCEKVELSFITYQSYGYELIEHMKLAVKTRSESDVQYLLERLFECKTNKKYFKQNSASLMYSAITNGAENVIPHLVSAGAQRFNLNSDGDTDILLAVRHKQLEVLKSLLKFKQNINSKNRKGHFPLFLAVEVDMMEAVKLLLKAGANVNVKLGHSVKMSTWLLGEDYFPKYIFSVLGDTLPHLIVRRIAHVEEVNPDESERYCKMLNMILDANFRKSLTNSKGHTLFDEVILNKLESTSSIFQRLVRGCYPIQLDKPFHHACILHPNSCVYVLEAIKNQYGQASMLKMVNSAFDTSFQPLFVACQKLNTPAVEWLLQNEANPNNTSSKPLTTTECCSFLDRGINTRTRLSYSLTPMHIAVSWVRFSSVDLSNAKNILELLISCGADVNAKDSIGRTPLHCALVTIADLRYRFTLEPAESLLNEIMSVILLLFQAGADPDTYFNPYQLKIPKLLLEDLTDSRLKHVVMMVLELSASMAREGRMTIKNMSKHLCHLSSFVPESVIDRCLKQPRSLMVLSRRVILQKSHGRHLCNTQKYFHMLPVRLQDYVCLKHLQDPQWYIDQA